MFNSQRLIRFSATAALMALLCGGIASAQQSSTAPEDSFTLDAAILDTSIPFSVGAHEARQELRGAFGWPTFQEGLVQGVYFRFDPDGYARFSPTPRLDTDVFEVICRPRTHVCMARKDSLTLTLNNRNQIQLALENVTEADDFLIAEGISELPLPSNILNPLDGRMELILSSGGDLVVSRAKKEVDRISLKGFAAVTAYLRWVSAQQSYTVLPRDWPVPNSGSATAEITKSAKWQSPMPKPLAAELSYPDEDVAEVRGELRVLRELLLKGETAAPQDREAVDRLSEVQRALDALALEIETLKTPDNPIVVEAPQALQSHAEYNSVNTIERQTAPLENDAQLIARRMEYLMTEIGLEPEVALMLLKQGEVKLDNETETTPQNLVDELLADLRANLPTEAATPELKPNISASEYQLLTDYFQSVFDEI